MVRSAWVFVPPNYSPPLLSSSKSVSVVYPAMKFNTSHVVTPGVCLHTSGFMFLLALSHLFSLVRNSNSPFSLLSTLPRRWDPPPPPPHPLYAMQVIFFWENEPTAAIIIIIMPCCSSAAPGDWRRKERKGRSHANLNQKFVTSLVYTCDPLRHFFFNAWQPRLLPPSLSSPLWEPQSDY